jgi:hypothetical protein
MVECPATAVVRRCQAGAARQVIQERTLEEHPGPAHGLGLRRPATSVAARAIRCSSAAGSATSTRADPHRPRDYIMDNSSPEVKADDPRDAVRLHAKRQHRSAARRWSGTVRGARPPAGAPAAAPAPGPGAARAPDAGAFTRTSSGGWCPYRRQLQDAEGTRTIGDRRPVDGRRRTVRLGCASELFHYIIVMSAGAQVRTRRIGLREQRRSDQQDDRCSGSLGKDDNPLVRRPRRSTRR